MKGLFAAFVDDTDLTSVRRQKDDAAREFGWRGQDVLLGGVLASLLRIADDKADEWPVAVVQELAVLKDDGTSIEAAVQFLFGLSYGGLGLAAEIQRHDNWEEILKSDPFMLPFDHRFGRWHLIIAEAAVMEHFNAVTAVIVDDVAACTRDEPAPLVFLLVVVHPRLPCFRPFEDLEEGIAAMVGRACYINWLHALGFDIDAAFADFRSYFAT